MFWRVVCSTGLSRILLYLQQTFMTLASEPWVHSLLPPHCKSSMNVVLYQWLYIYSQQLLFLCPLQSVGAPMVLCLQSLELKHSKQSRSHGEFQSLPMLLERILTIIGWQLAAHVIFAPWLLQVTSLGIIETGMLLSMINILVTDCFCIYLFSLSSNDTGQIQVTTQCQC